ncbi:MAG: tetratricopeptide repeat protein [Bacteroidales bacterium]
MKKILLISAILSTSLVLEAQLHRVSPAEIPVTGEHADLYGANSGFYNASGLYLQSALELEKEGKLKEALAELNKAVELQPDFAEAIDQRGMVLLQLGKFSKAIRDFNRVIELMPGSAEYYNHRGVANYCIRQFELALRDYTLAIQMDPSFARAYYNRGILNLETGDKESAIEDFTIAGKYNHPEAANMIAELE